MGMLPPPPPNTHTLLLITGQAMVRYKDPATRAAAITSASTTVKYSNAPVCRLSVSGSGNRRTLAVESCAGATHFAFGIVDAALGSPKLGTPLALPGTSPLVRQQCLQCGVALMCMVWRGVVCILCVGWVGGGGGG
jgi:hypothetical protein